MDGDLAQGVSLLSTAVSSEGLFVLTYLLGTVFLLGCLRVGGCGGLWIYVVLVGILANLQVLKMTTTALSPQPVALGTVLFSSLFLAQDLITERYGASRAMRGTFLSILAQLFVLAIMMTTLAHPIPPRSSFPDTWALWTQADQSIRVLFLPSARIFIASITAFGLSHVLDIWIFRALKQRTHGRKLWLRQIVASSIAGLVDTLIFSILAWIILSPNPVSWTTLILSYVVPAQGTRWLLTCLSTPILYWSQRIHAPIAI